MMCRYSLLSGQNGIPCFFAESTFLDKFLSEFQLTHFDDVVLPLKVGQATAAHDRDHDASDDDQPWVPGNEPAMPAIKEIKMKT